MQGFTQTPAPVTLQGHGVTLSPLGMQHAAALEAATADGRLWELVYTTAPAPGQGAHYIAQALQDQQDGLALPFVVTDDASGTIIGTTRYYEIVPAIARLEIGYTWYAQRVQRTHVNTACKLLLLAHAFDTLGAQVVGWRTDAINTRSRAAIARLGAREEGVLRHHALRRDGSVRDSVMFSMLRAEWPQARDALTQRLHAGPDRDNAALLT